jgi:hypothetical protein
MQRFWPFYAGIVVAGVVTLVVLPIAVVAALVTAIVGAFGNDDAVMTGVSEFAVRDERGRMVVHFVNHSFQTVSVMMPGNPRPQRLLLRQEVSALDALGGGEGRVRVDAWPLDGVADLQRPPLYTLRAQGSGLSLGDDGMLWVERGGRRSAYALANGTWLFDSDSPVINFMLDGELRRMAALSMADEDLQRAVATITYASGARVLRRLLLTADDPFRARALRATMVGTRLMTRIDETGRRVIELPLPAGTLKLVVAADDLDLTSATVPPGLKLAPIEPWRPKG